MSKIKTVNSDVMMNIPPNRLEEMDLVLVGDTPLICHAWSKKAKQEMLNKQMGVPKTGREKRDPQRDFMESLYHLEGGGYGFPAIAFKNAAVTACTSMAGITKVAARQAFRVGNSLDGGEMVQILGDEPIMREDMVRVGMGTADIRFRGQFTNWWTVLRVRYNASLLSRDQLATLFETAGFAVGVGEWRMEKDGQFGSFHVANTEEGNLLMKNSSVTRNKTNGRKKTVKA